MTHPTDAAIAQAFREALIESQDDSKIGSPKYAALSDIHRRARELDAEKGGACDVPGEISVYCRINGCHAMTLPAITPPAQAAEAVERVARVMASCEGVTFGCIPEHRRAHYYSLARAAIAAMQAGEAK